MLYSLCDVFKILKIHPCCDRRKISLKIVNGFVYVLTIYCILSKWMWGSVINVTNFLKLITNPEWIWTDAIAH